MAKKSQFFFPKNREWAKPSGCSWYHRNISSYFKGFPFTAQEGLNITEYFPYSLDKDNRPRKSPAWDECLDDSGENATAHTSSHLPKWWWKGKQSNVFPGRWKLLKSKQQAVVKEKQPTDASGSCLRGQREYRLFSLRPWWQWQKKGNVLNHSLNYGSLGKVWGTFRLGYQR